MAPPDEDRVSCIRSVQRAFSLIACSYPSTLSRDTTLFPEPVQYSSVSFLLMKEEQFFAPVTLSLGELCARIAPSSGRRHMGCPHARLSHGGRAHDIRSPNL